LDNRADRLAAKKQRMEAFGRGLAQARKAKGLTQGQLAERSGVTQSAVSGWEAAKYLPDDPTDVFELERVLKVPVGFLSQHLGYVPRNRRSDPANDVETAIEESPLLTKVQKTMLVGAYRDFVNARMHGPGPRRT
jgi:transcriptional regulator with XRE-family HTH domain